MYFPNAQRELKRLDYKLRFNQTLLTYLNKLEEKNKGIILCGDFNVAHKEIDLKNPKTNQNNAGFSPQERKFFTELLNMVTLIHLENLIRLQNNILGGPTDIMLEREISDGELITF